MNAKLVFISRKKTIVPQIQSTLYEISNMIITKYINEFELLSHDDWGDWGVYIKHCGLHYYILITDTNYYRFGLFGVTTNPRPSGYCYEPTKPENYKYSCIRTNYKIKKMKMNVAKGRDLWYEWSFRNVKDYHCENKNKNKIFEYLDYSGSKDHKLPYFQYYSRNQKDRSVGYHTFLSKEQSLLLANIKLEKYYSLSSQKGDNGEDVICYYSTEVPSITEKEYNNGFDKMFKV